MLVFFGLIKETIPLPVMPRPSAGLLELALERFSYRPKTMRFIDSKKNLAAEKFFEWSRRFRCCGCKILSIIRWFFVQSMFHKIPRSQFEWLKWKNKKKMKSILLFAKAKAKKKSTRVFIIDCKFFLFFNSGGILIGRRRWGNF